MKIKMLYILCFFLIGVGILIRSVELLNRNFVFGFDQGRDYLAVRNIVVNRHLTLIGSEFGAGSAGFQGLFHGPYHYYFLSIPFILFNGDPYGGIVLMFTLGVLSIAASFFLGKELFGNKGGIILAALVALSPPLISQSRLVWNTNPSTLFIIVVFFSVFKIIRGDLRFIFPAAYFSAFIYGFQTGIAIPLCLTLIVHSLLVQKIKKWRAYAGMMAGFFLAVLPFLLFEIRHNFMGFGGLINYIVHNESTDVTQKFLFFIARDHWGTFVFNFFDSFPRHELIYSNLFLTLFVVSFIYIYKREKNKVLKRFFLYLFMLPIIAFAVFMMLRNAVYSYYLVSLNIAYLVLFTSILISAVKMRNKILVFILGLFVAVGVIAGTMGYIKTFAYDIKDYGGDAKIKGKTHAIDYIYQNARGEEFGLLIFSPPVYTYPYEYIIQWYGQKKYGYIPSQSKESLFYLLIEKDHYKPWSHVGWLETVVKTGKVMETKTLPSGLIIQKRVGDKL